MAKDPPIIFLPVATLYERPTLYNYRLSSIQRPKHHAIIPFMEQLSRKEEEGGRREIFLIFPLMPLFSCLIPEGDKTIHFDYGRKKSILYQCSLWLNATGFMGACFQNDGEKNENRTWNKAPMHYSPFFVGIPPCTKHSALLPSDQDKLRATVMVSPFPPPFHLSHYKWGMRKGGKFGGPIIDSPSPFPFAVSISIPSPSMMTEKE